MPTRIAFRIICKGIVVLALLLLSASGLLAQENFPLDRDAMLPYDKLLNIPSVSVHSAIKPLLNTDLAGINDSSITYKHFRAAQHNQSDGFKVELLPFNNTVSGGYDLKNHNTPSDLCGSVNLRVLWSDKVAVVFNALGGYSVFPSYVDSTVRASRVVPGTGIAYKNGNAYTYQDYTGYISYSPNKVFNVQLGKDKNFFGDGYRSMFLSDNASPYPFLKLRAHVGRFEYVNLYTMMADDRSVSGLQKDIKQRYTAMQYLSWNMTKRINVCFFETIVWQGTDTNRVRGFDINYMNPVLFLRPTEYSLGSPDNALVGTSFKFKLPGKIQLYGQALFDEFVLHELLVHKGWWGNKFSIQAGMKAFDLFGINNLYMLGEVNYVRPYTYTHGSVQQNYSGLNQPLADPFGANFEEAVGILNYRYKRMIFELKGVVAFTGLDTAGSNWGQNIFLPYDSRTGGDYNHRMGDGLKTVIGTAGFRTSCLIIPSWNLKAELGFTYQTRKSSGRTAQDAALITFGIKTALYNTYRDY
ncbi:MAG: hypothetical protein ACHQRM_12790 [Bacteroidia bacterium]